MADGKPRRPARPRNLSPAEAFTYYMPGNHPQTDCWLWAGPLKSDGYGAIFYSTGKHKLAHRVAYELFHGPIPEGLSICHHCDNPPCCNPNHLYAGDHVDNARDMVVRGRSAKGKPGWWTKLSADQVHDIRCRYAGGGVSMSTLSHEFAVSETHIWRIIHNLSR